MLTLTVSTIVVMLLVLGGLIYSIRESLRVQEHLIHLMEQRIDPKQRFMCYYCQNWFPLDELEQIGKYDYCPAHGSVRKDRLLKEECGVC